MSPRVRFGFAVTGLLVALIVFSGWMAAGKRPPKVEASPFAQAVDLTALGNVAVHTEGRLKSLDSFAQGLMAFISGPRRYEGQSPTFTYLDIMLRPEAYMDADVVFVKNKPLRADIVSALEGGSSHHEPEAFEARMQDFLQWGMISPHMLGHGEVQARLRMLGQDLMRSAKFVQEIEHALQMMDPGVLAAQLDLVPPAGDDPFKPWNLVGQARLVAGLDAEVARQADDAWVALQKAWKAEDAGAATASANELAALLPRLNPALYPSIEKLSWESWYFHQNNLTWIWMIYLLALVALLLWFVYGWKGAGWLGAGIFTAAFLLQTGALGLRWWVSGRFPNSNMFEAVTTAAWFGGVAAVFMELVARRSAMKGLFATASAAASMVALMCAHYMPLQLNPTIGNMMPVLHDVWLYIHTNVIIWSYILIFMAAFSGLLYLLHRACGGAPVHSTAGGLRMAAGGAAAMRGGGGGRLPGDEARHSSGEGMGRVLDGVTMDLMKLSFVMLWAGLVMGAIWADHSWGRPWGWDPKEVFALNTFLVFAVLVHVRWKAKDKGLWTAWLAVGGAAVMLFNWIVINFYISGLHSYA